MEKLRILLVEDTQRHIDAAKSQLSEHELTIVTGFDQAHEQLIVWSEEGPMSEEPLPFDVLLTDVMIPKGGNKTMSPEGANLAARQGPMPYGPIIALHALQHGIKRVGILTDGSHHDDPFVFALDYLKGFQTTDIRVVCSNDLTIPMDDYVKDWATLLNRLII